MMTEGGTRRKKRSSSEGQTGKGLQKFSVEKIGSSLIAESQKGFEVLTE